MTTEQLIANTLWFYASGMVLLWLYFGVYSEYRVERMRTNLFRLRSQLFELGAQGKIPFDHPAYGMLRSMLNRNIRFAHRGTLVEALLFGAAVKRDDRLAQRVKEHADSWRSAVSAIDPASRSELERIHQAYQRAVIEQLFISSPVIWAVATPFVVVLMLVQLWALFTQRFYALVLPRFGSAIDALTSNDDMGTAAA